MGSAYPTGAIVVPFGTNGTQPLPFKRSDRVASGSSREPQAVSLRLPGEADAPGRRPGTRSGRDNSASQAPARYMTLRASGSRKTVQTQPAAEEAHCPHGWRVSGLSGDRPGLGQRAPWAAALRV